MVRTERDGDVHRVDTDGAQPIYRHDRRGTYHAWIEFDYRDPVLSTVVSTVGLATGTDAVELDPLSTTVDPEALERLLAHWKGTRCDGRRGTITFAYEDCEITIRADGEVVVSPPTRSG